jgi:costal 2 protein
LQEKSNLCFRLEFAASQWLKLVANAEDLFSKLVVSKCLSQDEKDQVERWLCLKQECEECVGSDDTISCKGFEGRMLERIGMPPTVLIYLIF